MITQPPKLIIGRQKKGRPTAEFNRRTFEELCKILCTKQEIANVMGISQQTVWRRCQEIYGGTFEEVYARFADFGLVSLRRSQFALAKKSASMAIFLGKQYLGQSEQGYTSAELAKAIDREIAKLQASNSPQGSTDEDDCTTN